MFSGGGDSNDILPSVGAKQNQYGIFSTREEALRCKIPLQKLVAIAEPSQVKTRLLGYWSTVAVVCALLTTMSVQSFLAPPDFNKYSGNSPFTVETTQFTIELYAFLNGASFALLLGGVLFGTIFYAIGNQLPTDDAVLSFIQQYSRLLPLPTILFVSGTIGYLASLYLAAALLYGVNWGSVAATGVMVVLIMLVFYTWISMQKFSVVVINRAIESKPIEKTKPIAWDDPEIKKKSVRKTREVDD